MMVSPKNRTVKCIAALCMAAVLLASVPHHHHHGSAAVCFNLAHCWNESGHHHHRDYAGACTDPAHEHGHHPSEPSGCHLKIDAAELLKQQMHLPYPLTATAAVLPDLTWRQEDRLSGFRYRFCEPPFLEPLTDYIASALPPRAPCTMA